MHPVVDHDQSQTVKLTFHLQTTHSNTLKTIVRNYTTRIPNIHLTVKKKHEQHVRRAGKFKKF